MAMSNFTKVCFEALSISLTLVCLASVIYQSADCFAKFLGQPKTTSIDIEEAFLNPYPSITICYADIVHVYEETLKKCNLTYDHYYGNNIWIGNGTETFCKDPLLLYEEMTKGDFILGQINLTDQNSNHIIFDGTEDNFQFMDDDYFGRCRTFNPPRNINIWSVGITFWTNDTFIWIHSPKSYYGGTFTGLIGTLGKWSGVNLDHEYFETLNSEKDSCRSYDHGRDHCITSTINEVSIS